MSVVSERLSPKSDASDGALRSVLWVIRLGPALILLLLCVILTLATPFFLTGDNITNLLVQVAPLAALAIGQLFVVLVPAKPSWLRSFGWVNDRAMSKETDELLERLQVNVQKNMEIGLMSGGQRQAVACARAMAFGQRIVILDEPTSALGARESGNVLRLIKEAPDNGLSVILISHNLEHVMKVADRAVVLRQGSYIGEAVPDEQHHEELVGMIVGGGESPDGGKGTDTGSDEGQASVPTTERE